MKRFFFLPLAALWGQESLAFVWAAAGAQLCVAVLRQEQALKLPARGLLSHSCNTSTP